MSNVNKVVYNGQTLVDLTSDTVTEETLASGYTAHNASGTLIVGTASTSSSYVDQYLSECVDITIDTSTDVIVTTSEEATITTTFSSDGNTDTITSNISMNDGDYDYQRVTTITENDNLVTISQKLNTINK